MQQPIRSYEDLIVWQKALDLVTDVYRCTAAFPRNEIYGITCQLRRAAVSVPSNIAEGQGRTSTGEFKQFLATARGSLYEVNTQIHITQRLGMLSAGDAEHLLASVAEVGRLLNGLLTSLPRTEFARHH